jgi:hypothetical protein
VAVVVNTVALFSVENWWWLQVVRMLFELGRTVRWRWDMVEPVGGEEAFDIRYYSYLKNLKSLHQFFIFSLYAVEKTANRNSTTSKEKTIAAQSATIN